MKKIAPIVEHVISPIIGMWIKHVYGLENLPKKGGFILAPNHCSYIENIMVARITIPNLNKKLHIIAKKEHFESLSQSIWHSIWNKYIQYIPIDRSQGEAALVQAENALKKGAMLLIYPEGTRSLDGELQRGKTGIARLVLKTHVPVIPVGFIGTFHILPKGKNIPRFKRAFIHFGKPMHFEQYFNKPMTHDLLREITDSIMREIAKLINKKYNYR